MEKSKNINDQRIINLKDKLKESREKLNPIKFNPETHCRFRFNGNDLNFHVISTDQLLELKVYLTSQKQVCETLKLGDITIQGFKISEWLNDIDNKLEFNNYKEEVVKQKEIEKKLDILLSEETKTQLELDEIENLLK